MNLLLVCSGNICRSPMAEGLARHLAQVLGRKDLFFDSAGTHALEGCPPDARAQATMAAHGLPIAQLRARRFSRADFFDFDAIWVADAHNLAHCRRLAPTPDARAKVALLRPDGQELPDPYRGGEEGFERSYQMLEQALRARLSSL